MNYQARNTVRAALLLLAGVAAAPAFAATQTASMNVSTMIPTACTLGGVVDLVFPPPTGLTVTQDDTASGSVDVTCTNGGTYTVSVNDGLNFSAGSRRMRKGSSSAYLTYSVYTDSGRSAAFPTTTQIGNGSAQTVPIFGRLEAQTALEAGAYNDTVTVTVTY